jgi:hypothetical protein
VTSAGGRRTTPVAPRPPLPTLHIPWRGALRLLWVAATALCALSVALRYATKELRLPYTASLAARLSIDGEATVPAWFSSGLIAACALALLAIAGLERARGAGDARHTRHWALLGALFVVLSAEEIVDFHTIPIFPGSVVVGVRDTLGAPWLLVGIPFVALFVAANVRFLRALPPRTRNGFLAAGAVYVGGALGVEAIEVVHYFREGYDGVMVALVTLEEWMEMAGMLLLLGVLLRHVERSHATVAIRLAPRPVREIH